MKQSMNMCDLMMLCERFAHKYFNDLFSRFEQQTSILEKLAEAMDPTTDRRRVSFKNT